MAISRRNFLTQAAATGAALRFGKLFAQSGDDSVTVSTTNGRLRGTQAGGAKVFRGVPFADPPVMDLRFRAPVAKKTWTGVRDARQFSAAAMQPGVPAVPQSEDCLYLNLWAPEGKGPFPVFVWIHGGGFTGGHSFDPTYDGVKFARDGIVCITVAYRLGVLGFLDVEPLLGAEYAGSANNALRDLIMALEWVREHVSDFGGDPSRVTIGGESAGAKLTDILMGVPSAQPLFQQMISESGGAERIWSKADAGLVGSGFGGQWKRQKGRAIADMKTADAKELIGIQKDFIETWPGHFPLRAEIDGSLVPRAPVETIAKGSTRGKRLLIGTNKEESALFVGPHPAKDATARDLGNVPPARFQKVFRRYSELYPDLTKEQLRIRALTAEEYWVPSMRVLDAHVSGGGRAWSYRLDFAESSGRLEGYAYHSLDLPLVWDKPHEQVDNVSAETLLAKQVHAAWAAFIRGEAPTAAGLPDWPEYRSDTGRTMVFDAQSHIEQKPFEDELRAWDGLIEPARVR